MNLNVNLIMLNMGHLKGSPHRTGPMEAPYGAPKVD